MVRVDVPPIVVDRSFDGDVQANVQKCDYKQENHAEHNRIYGSGLGSSFERRLSRVNI